jgi:hypothetical protein
MTQYNVTVLADGNALLLSQSWPESHYERSCIQESAQHAAEQGYGRICVTVRDDGSSAYSPLQ